MCPQPVISEAFNTWLLETRKGKKKRARQMELRRPNIVTIYTVQSPKWKDCLAASPLVATLGSKGVFPNFNLR